MGDMRCCGSSNRDRSAGAYERLCHASDATCYAAAPVFSLPVCSPAPVDGSVDGVFSVVAFGVGVVEVLVVSMDSESTPDVFCSPSCCGTAFSLSRTTLVNGFGLSLSGMSESSSVDACTSLSVDTASAVRVVVDVVVAVD